jgi:hypothetical protein
MIFRRLLAAAVVAGAMFVSAAPQAATITSSFSAWSAGAGSAYSVTSDTGLPLYSTISSVPLSNGYSLGLSGTADTVLQPLSGWGPWSGTYSGQIVDTTTNSETISFQSSVSALGFDVDPDLGLFSNADSFTVSLSDGTTSVISGTYPAGTTQFIGFYGSGITSLTITAANSPDFAFGNIVSVPEPSSITLLMVGLAGLAVIYRRTRV